MLSLIRRSNWFTGIIIFFMPVLLIFFLASQMAYSQVKSRFETYQDIPEVGTLSELASIPADRLVMLRGRISETTAQDSDQTAPDLIIFQVRPADGREVRFQEEFPLIFPEFAMELSDGTVTILPSLTREHIIQNEPHRVSDGEYEFTGFRVGDSVMVQGQWQSRPETGPVLVDVTGITGADKASLIAAWQSAFQKVAWARNILGLLTVLSIILLVTQLRRTKGKNLQEENENWQTQRTKTIPTT